MSKLTTIVLPQDLNKLFVVTETVFVQYDLLLAQDEALSPRAANRRGNKVNVLDHLPRHAGEQFNYSRNKNAGLNFLPL